MKATCLCGDITIETTDHQKFSLCHCNTCRKWGGGPMFAVHVGADVTFSGSGAPTVYRSSEWAERGFCSTCGTHLFYHLLPANDYILPAGLFQDKTDFEMASQIFIDEKPGYYTLANQTKELTGAQVFAQYSGDNKSSDS